MDPIINIKTVVDQSGLDSGLTQVNQKVDQTSKQGSSAFASMFSALALTQVIQKGFQVVNDFFKDSIAQAKEAEQNTLQLKNTLASLGKEGNLEQITESAKKLSERFAIDDDAILKTTLSLENYGKLTEKQIQDLQPVIIDYAAKTGKSMDEATNLIIKGLNGQGKEFKQLGVELDKGGTTAENLGVIMTDLAVKVKGAGETFANSAEGKLAKFHNTLDDLKKNIGGQLLPIITQLTVSLTPLLNQIGPIIEKLMPTLSSLLQSLTPVIESLGQIVLKIAAPLGKIFKVVGDALSDLMPLLTPVLDAFGDLVSTLLQDLVPVFQDVVKVITPIIKEQLPMFTSLIKSLTPVLSTTLKIIGEAVTVFFELYGIIFKLTTPLREMTQGFLEFASNALGKVLEKVEVVTKFITKLVDGLADLAGIDKPLENVNNGFITLSKLGVAVEESNEKIVNSTIDANKKILDSNKETQDKTKEAIQKHLDEISALNDKYFTTERDKIAKGYDDDIAKLNQNNATELQLYKDLLDQKAQALANYDLKKQQELEASNQKSLDLLTSNEQKQSDIQKQFKVSQEEVDAQFEAIRASNSKLTDDEIYNQIQQHYQSIADVKQLNADNDAALNQTKLESERAHLEESGMMTEEFLNKELEFKIANLEAERQAELLAAEAKGADLAAINAKYDIQVADAKTTTNKEIEDNEKKHQESITKSRIDAAQKGIQTAKAFADVTNKFGQLSATYIDSLVKRGKLSAEDAAKKKFKVNKALGIVNATIDTAGSVIGAINNYPGPVGYVLAALNGIAGAVQIGLIASQKFTPEGGGGGAAPAAPSMPNLSSAMSDPSKNIALGANKIAAPVKEGLDYQKVYVTETDIRKTIGKVEVIENRSKIG